MENGDDLFEKYSKEMELDVQLDALNMMDKQYSLPNVKHKWLYRKVQCEKNLHQLYRAKDQLISLKIRNEPINLSKPKLKSKMEDEEDIQRVNEEIKSYELLVDYLKIFFDKTLCGMSFDIKNLIALIQSEQN